MSARPLTVVQALPRLESGGVERGTVEVAGELMRLGHRAIVLSAGGPMVVEIERAGGEHVTMNVAKKSPLTLATARELRRLLRETHADVLHARSRVPAWVCLFALRGMKPDERPRFVTTVHGLNSVNRYSEIMTRGELVVAVSDAAKRHVTESYPLLDPARVRVIHRGVDPEEYPHGYTPSAQWLERWRNDFPQLAGARLLTTIGRLTRLKGHHEFITLLGGLTEERADVRGLIVGGEDPRRLAYARELRARIEREGLSDRVILAGHRSDAREIASISRAVCCLSSTPESFGRTALEALRLGTPVLGWDHGGVGEILREVYPDGAVPLNDRDALARRASALIASEKQPVRPFDAFTKREMLEKIIALYEEVAGVA